MMMSWGAATFVLLGGVGGLMLLGLPVALAFLGLNLVGAALFLGGPPGLVQLARNSVAAVTNFALTPIPLFVLMGEVLFHTGVALRAITAIERIIRRVPGRLAVVAIVAGTIFSAISGSTIATTALLGSLMLPEMLKRGYEPRFAMGPIMGIGGVDMLIPPSALAVLLGSLAGISIAKLLVAGTVPGLIVSALFVGYIVLRAKLDPRLAPVDVLDVRAGGLRRWLPLIHVLPLMAIFGAVVRRCRPAGRRRPRRRRSVPRRHLVAAAQRSLGAAALQKALVGTAGISGIILFIIVGATAFAQILSFSGATNGIVALIADQRLSTIAVLLGMVADPAGARLLRRPGQHDADHPAVLHAAGAGYAIDPIWFGVIFLICMQLGLLTPPFGLLLFTMKGVAPPGITIGQVYRAAMPYVWIGLAVLALVIAVPGVATLVPRLLFR